MADSAVTTILHKRSNDSGAVPHLTDLALGELAINTHDGNIFIKRNKAGAEAILKFTGDEEIAGKIFVQKKGHDTNNNGKTWGDAFLTPERAISEAWSRNEPTVICIGPGTYYTKGHLDLPDDTIVYCEYRAVVFKPETGYEQRNVFRMGSGCFLQGPVFEGFQIDDINNPTEGFAVSFRPNALIRRTPYAHKIAVRSFFPYFVAPPLDRDNANPEVTRGGGVCLADAAVLDPFSIYPQFMTWGATPVTQNGVGYVAKNGAGINAVNAISIWAHKHFMALSGSQIVLSSCSTQLGDFTLVADGSRNLLVANELGYIPPAKTAAAAVIDSDFIVSLKNDAWNDLYNNDLTLTWTDSDEVNHRRTTGIIAQSLAWVLKTTNEKPWKDTQDIFYDQNGTLTITGKESQYKRTFDFIDSALGNNVAFDDSADNVVRNLFTNLKSAIDNPTFKNEPSNITAIGHTFNSVMAGVALTQMPPFSSNTTIEESILETNGGEVIVSGQDDDGSAIFVGGMRIDGDTGELSGPPFESAVSRIALKAAISSEF